MNLKPEFSIAIEAAIVAGIAVKAIYHSKNYDIEIKADDSPVTRADKTSSEIIAKFLSSTSIPFIDEENCAPDYSFRRNWKSLWLVDPMDGTKEFISGNGEFTINIALVEEGIPVFGVIYTPVTGQLYWGGKITRSFKAENVSKWLNIDEILQQSVGLNPEISTSHELRVAASRSHLDEHTKVFIEKLKEKFGPINFVSKGSSLKLCMIAEGSTDIYPRFSRTMEWDTAAGHALVLGTGGVLLKYRDFESLQYNKEDLANPAFFALSGIQLKKGLEDYK